MIVARRYVITGHVQGVGFRYFARAAAARAGVHGWVRNLPGGSVEAFVEGEQSAVDAVEASLRRGPSSARIDDVQVTDETPTRRAAGFFIR
jgi:acylphosphatase